MSPKPLVSHNLIPEHVKLKDKEKKELFEELKISFADLPKILKRDPAIAHLEPKVGDVIRIMRKSPTAGEALFYRGVVNN
ncbi:MAG: DNA-directed RNA polymerase subunit H [Nanoarchaeota archaeon]